MSKTIGKAVKGSQFSLCVEETVHSFITSEASFDCCLVLAFAVTLTKTS